ncbi:MAG: DHH family phosphoesterase [Verrucomicrobia bacterium]|nr:DHH family phosphoesterase [Verrucomicrobiota bacterium]
MRDFCQPEVIVTHESDLDGLVSGLLLQRLAQRLFGLTVPLQACHNHNWRQRALTERCAWVTDFAFEPRLDRSSWLVVDHHPFERPPKVARLIHDPAKSAALLCYELCAAQGLASPSLDRLVHLSNVADLFLMDDPDFELATDYANLVKSYGFWNLHALIGGDLERLLDHPLLEVMAVKRRVEDPLGLAWSRANLVPLSSEVAFVSTIVGNSNLIVHRLLREDRPPYPVLLTLFRKGNGMIIASLRSRNGEAQQIAELLKGGGHPNAAGATLPRSIQQIPEALEYLRHVLNPPPPSEPEGLAGLEAALESSGRAG